MISITYSALKHKATYSTAILCRSNIALRMSEKIRMRVTSHVIDSHESRHLQRFTRPAFTCLHLNGTYVLYVHTKSKPPKTKYNASPHSPVHSPRKSSIRPTIQAPHNQHPCPRRKHETFPARSAGAETGSGGTYVQSDHN